MRDIKFRAWDEEQKHMVQVEGLDFRIPKLYGKDERGSWHDMDLKYYTLMQYTGILDKNGKEIYEGDIVELTIFPTDEEGNMKQIRERSEVQYLGASFFLKQGVRLLGGVEPHRELEVIGNIYETPELLKVKPINT